MQPASMAEPFHTAASVSVWDVSQLFCKLFILEHACVSSLILNELVVSFTSQNAFQQDSENQGAVLH